MKAATGVAFGPQPNAELAEAAVAQALASAKLGRAGCVVLFLSADFKRHAQAALLAAARVSGCLQIVGGTTNGLFTERGWRLEQSAAAALVIEQAASPANDSTQLSFCNHGTLPFDWQTGTKRAGLLQSDGLVWSHGRLIEQGKAEATLPGYTSRLALSQGLRILGEAQRIDTTNAYDVRQIAGQTAVEQLRRCLPPELRSQLPLHQIVALRHPGEPGIPILSANGDGSLTLAECFQSGEALTWALRHPLAAEQDMRRALDDVVATSQPCRPAFALMYSCIGRGPLFYGDDDHDLQAFRQRFPDTPLLGAYGSGQIGPCGGRNRLFHNSVITQLFESAHV
ncbi:MAG: hypothetical protein D3M94_16265 [Rhodocyclales bacterium GT-UBC]|nr:MAG: hypothetical protein D3M94_16265 [Rhodocyclales bacterium GT-UBC]